MIVEAFLADEEATLRIAGQLSLLLAGSGLVFLEGGLGAGKTTFSRGILRAMGYQGAVKSPTFTIVEPYDINGGQVYHFDLYRLNDPEELEYLGMNEYLEAKQLCLIEWPERGAHFLPLCDVNVGLELEGDGRRAIIKGLSASGIEICQNLSDILAS